MDSNLLNPKEHWPMKPHRSIPSGWAVLIEKIWRAMRHR
jgi:hypothetical protein